MWIFSNPTNRRFIVTPVTHACCWCKIAGAKIHRAQWQFGQKHLEPRASIPVLLMVGLPSALLLLLAVIGTAAQDSTDGDSLSVSPDHSAHIWKSNNQFLFNFSQILGH
jgi:hypothetical protein